MPSWTHARAKREAERVEARKTRYGGRVVGGVDQPGLEPPRKRDVVFPIGVMTEKGPVWSGFIPLDSPKACQALLALLHINPIDQPHCRN